MKKISRQLNKTALALIAAFVVIAALATALFFSNERLAVAQHEATDNGTSLVVRALQTGDHVIGDRNAPIKIFVYSDLSCPYCKAFFDDTMPRLWAAYGQQIAIVYRHLPLVDLHPRAVREAEAAECAAVQGGDAVFWKFVKRISDEPDFVAGIDDVRLARFASDLGVDEAQFNACLERGDMRERVRIDQEEAAVAGINYTPTSVIKSPSRAVIVKGLYYPRYQSALDYLISVEEYLGDL